MVWLAGGFRIKVLISYEFFIHTRYIKEWNIAKGLKFLFQNKSEDKFKYY
jgi:hypothetical protein